MANFFFKDIIFWYIEKFQARSGAHVQNHNLFSTFPKGKEDFLPETLVFIESGDAEPWMSGSVSTGTFSFF